MIILSCIQPNYFVTLSGHCNKITNFQFFKNYYRLNICVNETASAGNWRAATMRWNNSMVFRKASSYLNNDCKCDSTCYPNSVAVEWKHIFVLDPLCMVIGDARCDNVERKKTHIVT